MSFFPVSRSALNVFAIAIGLFQLLVPTANAEPVTVTVDKEQQKYQLRINGEPFTINGVGLSYRTDDQIKALKKAGGNAYRTWGGKTLDHELALAKELGLMIAVGLETGKELQGFDYDDEAAVAKQYAEMTAIIDKYKDHPSVLCWVIANEPNLLMDEQGDFVTPNPRVYDALGQITDYIHKVDPNHPVTIAFAGAHKGSIETALARIPQLDIVSVQLYGSLGSLGEIIKHLDIDKPVMVTEFGPKGHWENPTTEWGREIEEPSAVKAEGMAARMNKAVLNDQTGQVVGSFAFLWGQKQERTPTWYGMFNASGEQTARIDELTKVWTGSYPDNRAPLSYAITINGQKPVDSVYLKPGERARAKVVVSDPDGDELTTRWLFMGEVRVRSQGGHHENAPEEFPVNIHATRQLQEGVEIEFTAPADEGEYRLFSYSYDGHNNVANANIPFKVGDK
jgi:hypothetical protein